MRVVGQQITTAHFEELGAYLFACLVLGIALGVPVGMTLLLVFILGHAFTFLIHAFVPNIAGRLRLSEVWAMRVTSIVNGVFALALVAGTYLLLTWLIEGRTLHSMAEFVRDNPSCTSFSNGCIVCEKAVDSDATDAVCSTPGIACTPRQFKCYAPIE